MAYFLSNSNCVDYLIKTTRSQIFGCYFLIWLQILNSASESVYDIPIMSSLLWAYFNHARRLLVSRTVGKTTNLK